MPNFILRIIRPVERTAEYIYLKEFFRFIGFLVMDCAVDDAVPANWLQALVPDEKSRCVDIVINGPEDPYMDRCRQLGIRRIYCKADFNTKVMECIDFGRTPEKYENKPNTKNHARQNFLPKLIDQIFEDEATRREVQDIADVYLHTACGEMFYYLQAKRNLRVLGMGEVLRERTAQVTNIALLPYVRKCIAALWEACCRLKKCTGLYGRYAWVNVANKIYEISAKLYDTERFKITEIKYKDEHCSPPDLAVLLQELETLLEEEPGFLSAYLLMANIYGAYGWKNNAEELCYQRLWMAIARDSTAYAFIWYRNAYFYEKRKKNLEKALEYYRHAVRLDPNCYQAMFKLGYYAAADKRFEQAEQLLKQMIQSIFHGRSTDPDENGAYTNWLALSPKESQYVYKAYMLLAKIALNRNQENAIRTYIGRASMAATRFEEATVVRQVSDENETAFDEFYNYHSYSTPVWAMWQVLSPWTENVIHDPFVRDIARSRLARWKIDIN